MFDAETTGGDALDEQLVTAGSILEKVAAELDIDISQMSDEVVAGYLAELMPETHQPEKTAADQGAPMEQQNELTYPVVFAELTKIAAAEQVDLTKLSAKELAETCEVLAQEMSNPDYGKVAAEVVQARQLGAEMAIGFAEKMAEFQAMEKTEKKEEASEKKEEKKDKDGDDDGEKEASAVKKLISAVGEKSASQRGTKTASQQEAFDAAVLARAIEMVKAAGIDPETGEKVASESDINAAAIELLRSKNYQV